MGRPQRKVEEEKQPAASAQEVEEAAGDMVDPFEMMGGMGEEQVYKVTLMEDKQVAEPKVEAAADSKKELVALYEELSRLRIELAEAKALAALAGSQPPLAMIIAAQEDTLKHKARADQATALLKGERATVARLTAELEKLKAQVAQAKEAPAVEDAKPKEGEPAVPNKRDRKKPKEQEQHAPAPAAAPAAEPAPAVTKKAPQPVAEPSPTAMARTTTDLADAQIRLAKRVAALEEQRRIEAERAEQRRKEEEQERREEEEAEKLRAQIRAEEEAREARKLEQKQRAEEEAAAKLRRKEERRKAAEQEARRMEKEKKSLSKEDFEALQLLREETDNMQPDAEVSPDELDEDEILEREIRRAQKEEHALKNKQPATFIEMLMTAEGMPMEVIAQVQQAQKNSKRNELRQKLKAKREMEQIQGVARGRR